MVAFFYFYCAIYIENKYYKNNTMKQTIRLNESELRHMIAESVKRVLNEVQNPLLKIRPQTISFLSYLLGQFTQGNINIPEQNNKTLMHNAKVLLFNIGTMHFDRRSYKNGLNALYNLNSKMYTLICKLLSFGINNETMYQKYGPEVIDDAKILLSKLQKYSGTI